MLVSLSLTGCDTVRSYGSRLVGAIPIVGPILEPFVGEWLADGEKALEVEARSELEAMMKWFIENKLAFVVPQAVIEVDSLTGDSLLVGDASRNNVGAVKLKLHKSGKAEVAYTDTTVTMELERK